MKTIVQYCLLLVIISIFYTTSFSQNKIALLVGVGEYQASTGWDQLNSVNDLTLIKSALLKQGFKPENISVITDEQATKNGILEAIEKKLLQKVDKGSVVIFHYSGHGQQMMDDNGDELDGLDEALVPFDSPKHFEAGVYEGEKLLRDDDLGVVFNSLRQKIGTTGQLLVTMDACHSGTATRSTRTARGTDVVMASDSYTSSFKVNSKNEDRWDEIPNIDALAPMISFFSSQAGQLSYERTGDDGKGYGLLSYSFSKLFSDATKNTSYRALFEAIRKDMQTVMSQQSPQAEGVLDVPLMRNQILGDAEYYRIKEVIDDYIVILNSGTLLGVYEGSTIAFYPPDTRDTIGVKPLAIGTVVYADITQADIEFSEAQTIGNLDQSWAYIKEKNYGHLKLGINLKTNDNAIDNYLKMAFAEHSILSITENQGDVVLTYKNEQIELRTIDGISIGMFTELNEHTGKAVVKKLLGYAQANYLRQLQINNPLLKSKIEVLQNGKQQNLENTPTYQVGDEIQLKITNTGDEPFYFSLLDIMPDNAVADVDLSGGQYTTAEMYLKPQQSFTSAVLRVGAPYGVDVFKLVTSTEAMDLSVIRGTNTRGVNKNAINPFEQLLMSTDNEVNTRGTTPNIPTSFDVNVETFVFEIKE